MRVSFPVVCFCLSASVVSASDGGSSRDARFVSWLKDGGVDLEEMGLEIADFPKEGGRGTHATRGIEEGATAVQVRLASKYIAYMQSILIYMILIRMSVKTCS